MRSLGLVRNLGRGPRAPQIDRASYSKGYLLALDDANEFLSDRSGDGYNEVAVCDFMQHLTDQRFIISGFSGDEHDGQRLGYTALLDRLYITLDSLTTGCSRDDKGLKQARILDMLALVSNMRDARMRKYGAEV